MNKRSLTKAVLATIVIYLLPTVPAYADGSSVEENNRKFCEKEWTSRGELDQRMFNSCMAKQNKGYAGLEAMTAKHKSLSWFARARAGVTEEWTKRGVVDYNMVRASLESEVDGYLDVEYMIEHDEVSQAKLARCKAEWSRKYEEWRMINACVNDYD